ncbi:DUF6456 domain-containing protein [Rhodobacter maris]|uniref:DUF6456 domain-containing protein n=1 Tax=Rhodobacter maris TaxID=446682 RepID=A0A285RX85_9RHOB|nr:DUF6456 domain-containing protein [Rhodobacter maris]SOB98676.1 hypothetical protein SAMN05877831_10240 [Rhodobacter maris]
MSDTMPTGADLPAWVPDVARIYLRHVEEGIPIRALARAEGCHASTILRRVRRIEAQRDDPLIDEVLARLGQVVPPTPGRPPLTEASTVPNQESRLMTDPIRPAQTSLHGRATSGRPGVQDLLAEDLRAREEGRILRRLAEPAAVLIVAPDMDKAVVLRGTVRTAVMARELAQALALRGWIMPKHTGRVTSYELSSSGRAELRRRLAEESAARGEDPGTTGAERPQPRRPCDWGEREVQDAQGRVARIRTNLSESPLAVLARRRDANGAPFLAPELVAAGERLREDFELAQMAPRVAQNWERFMTGGIRGQYRPDLGTGGPGGSERARARVAAALSDLGPGLGDMVLRCCCFLEGLEAAEKRMGWSARSGKIVLRIALMRLKRHYDETYGGAAPLIG